MGHGYHGDVILVEMIHDAERVLLKCTVAKVDIRLCKKFRITDDFIECRFHGRCKPDCRAVAADGIPIEGLVEFFSGF